MKRDAGWLGAAAGSGQLRLWEGEGNGDWGGAAAAALGSQMPSPVASPGPGGGAQVCGAGRERALRACERKCGARVTAPPPSAPPGGSVRRRVRVRVGRTGSQNKVLSTVLSRMLGLSPALRCLDLVDSQESSQRTTGSWLSAPERDGVAVLRSLLDW